MLDKKQKHKRPKQTFFFLIIFFSNLFYLFSKLLYLVKNK